MNATQKARVVRSMTGFSRVSFGGHGVELDVEVRSVNHRFLDVVVKGPRCYATFERDIKGIFQQVHKRGRIEVSIARRGIPEVGDIEVLPASIDRYVRMYGAACRRFGVSTDSLGSFIGQLLVREGSEEVVDIAEGEVAVLLRVIGEASEALAVMREREGDGLVSDISHRLSNLEGLVAGVSQRKGSAAMKIRDRLHDRVKLIAPDVKIDEQRFAAEVAFLCDRVDISEEVARAGIHLQGFRDALKGDVEGVGRKLDFLTQEIGRELNTIGSKAQDAEIQGIVVEAKAELERVREQVQNIE